LVDKVASKLSVDASKVKLKFDGETLQLGSTPADHDMEDDDLVDVLLVK